MQARRIELTREGLPHPKPEELVDIVADEREDAHLHEEDVTAARSVHTELSNRIFGYH